MAGDEAEVEAGGPCTSASVCSNARLCGAGERWVVRGSVPASAGRISARLRAMDLRFGRPGVLCQWS